MILKLIAAAVATLFVLSTTEQPGASDCGSSDIELIDSCLIGKTMIEAITQLKVDTSSITLIQEPPMILRGVHIVSDTCSITLYTDRTSIINKRVASAKDFRYLRNKEIKGVRWEKKNAGKKRHIGIRMWWDQ